MNNPLLTGKTCLESCDARCCHETEMLLTLADVERISRLSGLTVEHFAVTNDDGFYQLRNINGHCIFLDTNTKRCTIYSFKPSGCQVYPVIFDLDANECLLDDTCPFRGLITASELRKTCHQTKKIIEELLSDVEGT